MIENKIHLKSQHQHTKSYQTPFEIACCCWVLEKKVIQSYDDFQFVHNGFSIEETYSGAILFWKRDDIMMISTMMSMVLKERFEALSMHNNGRLFSSSYQFPALRIYVWVWICVLRMCAKMFISTVSRFVSPEVGTSGKYQTQNIVYHIHRSIISTKQNYRYCAAIEEICSANISESADSWPD